MEAKNIVKSKKYTVIFVVIAIILSIVFLLSLMTLLSNVDENKNTGNDLTDKLTNEDIATKSFCPEKNIDFEIAKLYSSSNCENDISVRFKGDVENAIALVAALTQPDGYLEGMSFIHARFSRLLDYGSADWSGLLSFLCRECLNCENDINEIRRIIEDAWNRTCTKN